MSDGDKNENESVAETIAKLRTFQKAGLTLLAQSPLLRAREETRMRGLAVKSGDVLNAASCPQRIGDTRSELVDVLDERRAEYFRSSNGRDPGPLSKFGEGDGSFFDNWLVSYKFRAPDGKVSFVGSDPLTRPSHVVPMTGTKQWTMPQSELQLILDRRWKTGRPETTQSSDNNRESALPNTAK